MSEILASVVIPHYRSKDALHECLENLLQQDLPPNKYEIIVVQNENSTLSLDSDFAKNVKIIYEPKSGSYRARNRGVKTAKGDYIFFTDSDCKPSKDWITKGLEHLNQGHSIIGGHIELSFLKPDRPKTIELYEKVFYFNQDVSINEESYAATANLIVKKTVFEEVGPFDASLMSGGDREWGRRAFKKGHPIFYAQDAVVFHPSRTKIFECLQRRVRIASNDLYIRMRKYGLSAEGKNELKKQLLSPPEPGKWSADWEYFKSLNDDKKQRVLSFHKLFSRIDYLVVIIGSFSFLGLKILTKIDRLRLK